MTYLFLDGNKKEGRDGSLMQPGEKSKTPISTVAHKNDPLLETQEKNDAQKNDSHPNFKASSFYAKSSTSEYPVRSFTQQFENIQNDSLRQNPVQSEVLDPKRSNNKKNQQGAPVSRGYQNKLQVTKQMRSQ